MEEDHRDGRIIPVMVLTVLPTINQSKHCRNGSWEA
jgi:hypothetical protein